jgi:hypothetical protein
MIMIYYQRYRQNRGETPCKNNLAPAPRRGGEALKLKAGFSLTGKSGFFYFPRLTNWAWEKYNENLDHCKKWSYF